MKAVINSVKLAFSGYSICPKTQIERTNENAKYILLFIPIIGMIIGVIISQWAIAYPYICNYELLPGVMGAVLPIILSGGVHLDGFFKTVDALCSNKSREHKLAILDDNHGGYFAIIVCVCYFLFAAGVWSEMPVDGLFILSYGFVISRALYGLFVLLLKHVKETKCMDYVPTGGLKYFEILVLLVYVVVPSYYMVQLNFKVGSACVIAAILSFLYCWFISKKHFGGITEDTAGFFVQVCEIMIPIAALVAYKEWWF